MKQIVFLSLFFTLLFGTQTNNAMWNRTHLDEEYIIKHLSKDLEKAYTAATKAQQNLYLGNISQLFINGQLANKAGGEAQLNALYKHYKLFVGEQKNDEATKNLDRLCSQYHPMREEDFLKSLPSMLNAGADINFRFSYKEPPVSNRTEIEVAGIKIAAVSVLTGFALLTGWPAGIAAFLGAMLGSILPGKETLTQLLNRIHPLMTIAMYRNDCKLLEYLLARGVDTAQNILLFTDEKPIAFPPLWIALITQDYDKVRCLLGYGAKIDKIALSFSLHALLNAQDKAKTKKIFVLLVSTFLYREAAIMNQDDVFRGLQEHDRKIKDEGLGETINIQQKDYQEVRNKLGSLIFGLQENERQNFIQALNDHIPAILSYFHAMDLYLDPWSADMRNMMDCFLTREKEFRGYDIDIPRADQFCFDHKELNRLYGLICELLPLDLSSPDLAKLVLTYAKFFVSLGAYADIYVKSDFVSDGLGDEISRPSYITLFHKAVRSGNIEAARILLKQGLNINTATSSGFLPLQMVKLHHSKRAAMVDLLLKGGVDIYLTDNSGTSVIKHLTKDQQMLLQIFGDALGKVQWGKKGLQAPTKLTNLFNNSCNDPATIEIVKTMLVRSGAPKLYGMLRGLAHDKLSSRKIEQELATMTKEERQKYEKEYAKEVAPCYVPRVVDGNSSISRVPRDILKLIVGFCFFKKPLIKYKKCA